MPIDRPTPADPPQGRTQTCPPRAEAEINPVVAASEKKRGRKKKGGKAEKTAKNCPVGDAIANPISAATMSEKKKETKSQNKKKKRVQRAHTGSWSFPSKKGKKGKAKTDHITCKKRQGTPSNPFVRKKKKNRATSRALAPARKQ